MLRPQRTRLPGRVTSRRSLVILFPMRDLLGRVKSGIDLRLNLLFELVDALANMFLLLLWRSFLAKFH